MTSVPLVVSVLFPGNTHQCRGVASGMITEDCLDLSERSSSLGDMPSCTHELRHMQIAAPLEP